MTERTLHVWNSFRELRRRRRGRRREGALALVAALALLVLGACFSPAPYTEHLCRECTSECPDGLVCHEQRCVRVCDASCVGDYRCEGGVCVPSSGALQCPTSIVRLALCVGRPVEGAMATSSSMSSGDPWVILDSRLPEGVSFDPDTGRLLGTPRRAQLGSLRVRQGEPGSEEVNLDLLATETCASIETRAFRWCSGQNHTERLVASREGSYEWKLSSTVPGLSQRGDELAGRIDVAGSYQIRVELFEAGRMLDAATIELTVDDCGGGPRNPGEPEPGPLAIGAPAALPDACQGGEYSVAFSAGGGAPPYRWSLAAAPPGLELDEASGVLSGTPAESGDYELTVRVDDEAGGHDEVSRALHVGDPSQGCPVLSGGGGECDLGASSCPRAELQIVTEDLGVACVGERFSARLEASGGGGDYRWTLLQGPSGLVLESSGTFQGVPSEADVGEHNVSVYVMSTLVDTPAYANVKLTIAACGGLVFISDEPGSDRLYHLSPGTGSSSELSQGVLGAGESVHTFAFAAGGAQLAFDVRGAAGAGRLYQVDLASLDVREAAFGDALPAGAALIDYRWSLDGRSLAATFRTGDGDVFLGVSPAAGGAGSSIEVSGRYLSSLFWAGERVCYVAPGLQPQFRGVLCHATTPEGVQNQAPLSGIFDPIDFREDLILSGDEGYLAILSTQIHADYVLPDERATSLRHTRRAFSADLRWAAGLAAGEASIGEVVTSQGAPSAPTVLARLDPCDGVDAWSLDARWIACRSGDGLAIHQLGPEGALAASARVADAAGHDGEEFRRLWAPQGQWYAYAAGGELRVVPTGAASPQARLVATGGASSSYAGLSTDPDGRRIFYHHGSELDVIDASDDYRFRNVSGDVLLSDPLPCVETYLEEGPRFWCGGPSTPAFVFPAPGAARVAFLDRQNRLYVASISGSEGAGSEGAGSEEAGDDTEGVQATSSPRLAHPSSVKCTMDSGETECDNFVQWVPRASR